MRQGICVLAAQMRWSIHNSTRDMLSIIHIYIIKRDCLIKNSDKSRQNYDGKNHRFLTLISLNLYKETTEALLYDNASAVFYLVLPKCDSPFVILE